MRWWAVLWVAATLGIAQADPIDQTCATCGRRSLDSANLNIHPVRVNQVGYRTDDPHKRALVGDPKATTFRVVRPNGTVAYSGNLTSQGSFPYKGRIMIKGYYNSINLLYTMSNTSDTDSASAKSNEAVSVADFGALAEEGTFRLVVGSDTSLPFDIRMTVYNDVFETGLKYFGIERSGDDSSQMHPRSHMKDGSGRPGGAAVAGSLRGGWYDCGDFFKVGQTDAYAFTNLILAYTLWPRKAEDRYGNSYNDTLPFGNDGIPDLLREAKVGADYVMRLYRASGDDGLLAKHDMYQEVGVWNNDHQLWDQPERQDMAPVSKGGPPRPVDAGAGAAVAAQFAGSLALFAKAWYPFDPAYSDSCLAAAKDIYKRVVIPNWETPGFAPSEFYVPQTRWDDDLAWAATGLWYATGDTSYRFDLMDNTTYGNYPAAKINASQKEFFWGGFLSSKHTNGNLFSPGGWVMDYQNTFIHTIWLMWDKFFKTDTMAGKWGIPATEAQDVRTRILKLVGTRYAHESTISPDGSTAPGTLVNIMRPYGLVWTSETWGMNRYNMGGLLPVVAYHEMIKDDSAVSARNYWNVILDNMNYNLGTNPWDISFLMGAGAKNLQHPHNRISNPEGYNAGGIPYAYRPPKGALMGGAVPGQLLLDVWEKFDVTETCIDFASQMVLPSQYLALDLPPDTVGPVFSNVRAYPYDTFAIVSWQTDELSRDTLFYSLTVNGPIVGYVVSPLAKTKSVTIPGLKPNTEYHFWFTGMDIYRNVSRDDNRGRDYDFTTTSASPPAPRITDVKACNIRSNQATIFWWTDVPATSAVEYAVEGANFATTKVRVDGDDEGIPARFHKVTLKGLQPNTTYRYDVFSPPSKSDSSGLHYRFSTGQAFASYTVQIVPTTKNASGAGAHFYLWISNTTSTPYYGLDLRFYFSADSATASSIQAQVTDKIIFDVTGVASPTTPKVSIGSALPVTGVPGTWYLPVHIADTLLVAGSERFDLDMVNGNWQPIPWSVFNGGWSLSAHTSPVAFAGVNTSKLVPGPDPVQNMQQVYVDDPYIGGYYNGQHIFGYTPDGDLPKVPRTVGFTFTGPRPSPATFVKQDTFMVHFAGRTWGKPDVQLMQVQRDSPAFVPTTPIASRTDSVSFAQVFPDPQGTTDHEWAFWADRNTPLCGCAWQRYTVTVDTMKVPPRSLRLVWTPAGPVDGWTSGRTSATVSLVDSAGRILDTTATVVLSSSNAGFSLWTAAAGGAAASSVVLVSGSGQVWVSSAAADSGRIDATASIPGSVVVGGSVWARFTDKPPRRLSLSWTPAGPIDGWAGSQRRSAVVSLLDSAGALLDTSVSVSLAVSKPGIQLWTAAAGGTATSVASLVHGIDTIWFSDLSADTGAIVASATVSGSTVGSSTLVVRLAAAPPWPLVDSAWTVDADCDGVPDSVAVRISAPLDTGSVLLSVAGTLGSAPLSLSASSVRSNGRDLVFPAPAALAGSATGTGTLSLHVTTGGRDQTVLDTFAIADRVRPQVVSASVLERFDAGNDTVRVEFDEPVGPPSIWPFASSGATPPSTVVSVRKLSSTLVEWVLSGGAFPAGSSLTASDPAGVVDLSGNPLATCAAAVPLSVRAKPDPMVSAAVRDPQGIGAASQVAIHFARSVRDVDLPDSLVLVWDGTLRTILPGGIVRASGDSSVLLATLAPPSPSGSGLRPGGLGEIFLYQGSGATGRRDSVAASDSVGPALRSAILRVGTDWDTLVLRLSERASEGFSPAADLFARSGVSIPASPVRSTTDSVRWILAVPAGTLQAGDSLRLAGLSDGAWRDRSGNSAAPAAPWIPLKIGDRAPATAAALDTDGDGRVDQVVLSWTGAPSRPHDFTLSWPDSTGRIRTQPVDSLSGTWSGNQLTIPVQWSFGATAGPGTGMQVDRYDDGTVDSLPFAIADGAAPVVVSARLGYASPGQSIDTLVVRFSESAVVHGPLVVRVRSKDGTVQDVSTLPWSQSSDGSWAFLPLDPANAFFTRFQKGDEVQAYPGASGVSDAAGNFALETGHFEPIVFGRRPPRFAISFEPGMTVEDGGAVPVTEPPVRIFVRPLGASTWTDLDGHAIDPSVVRLGPKILSNGPLSGDIHVFDNMGTHVVSRSLDDLRAAVDAGSVTADPSGQWEAWIAWDGRTEVGHVAASGIYAVRLVLRRPVEGGNGWDGWMNKVFRIGWIRKN
jgi:hypothetical protein